MGMGVGMDMGVQRSSILPIQLPLLAKEPKGVAQDVTQHQTSTERRKAKT